MAPDRVFAELIGTQHVTSRPPVPDMLDLRRSTADPPPDLNGSTNAPDR